MNKQLIEVDCSELHAGDTIYIPRYRTYATITDAGDYGDIIAEYIKDGEKFVHVLYYSNTALQLLDLDKIDGT